MSVLAKPDLKKIYAEKELMIESLDPAQPFDADAQITEDSIDLRLNTRALRYRADVHHVDTLFAPDAAALFEEIYIPLSGYDLQPQEVLFTSTLEVVCLATNRMLGRVLGRSTFARFGISVHCNQDKFPPGLAWVFPLQVVNHNKIPIRIYPYSYVVQLLIETTNDHAVSYDGKYDRDVVLHPPKIDERERHPVTLARTTPTGIEETVQRHLAEVSRQVLDFERRDHIAASRPKRRRRVLRRFKVAIDAACGAGSALFFGLFGNLFTNSESNYWKTCLMLMYLGCGIILLAKLIAGRAFAAGSVDGSSL